MLNILKNCKKHDVHNDLLYQTRYMAIIVITGIVLTNGVKLVNMQLALAVSNYAT